MKDLDVKRIVSAVIVLVLTGVGIGLTQVVPAAAAPGLSASCTDTSPFTDNLGATALVPTVGRDTGNYHCILGVGNTGWAVQTLQGNLNLCGGFNIAVDGVYGPQTRAAVETVQRNSNLPVDGVYGPQTRLVVWWWDDSGRCSQLARIV